MNANAIKNKANVMKMSRSTDFYIPHKPDEVNKNSQKDKLFFSAVRCSFAAAFC
jgi:hypothetical protein